MNVGKKISTIAIILFILMSFVLSIQAEEPERMEKIVASGIGVDADKARQNAIRNALEQAIGAYISSDTIVQNGEVLKDQVLSFSGGYVKETKIISQEKTDDGLFAMKIEALVVSSKLKRKLESLNIATKKVEGESLFGEAFSKIDQKKGGSDLLGKILTKYPQAAYVFEVGKPTIENTDHRNAMANVIIPLIIRWDKDFLREFKEILSQIATRDFGVVGAASFEKGPYRNIADGNQIVCFSTRATARSGKAEKCFALDKALTNEDSLELRQGNKRKAAKARGGAMPSLLKLPSRADSMSIFLAFKNAENESVTTATYRFSAKDDYRKRPSERQTGALSHFFKDILGNDDDDSKPQSTTGKRATKVKKVKSESYDIDHLLEGGNEYAAFYPPGILWRDPETSHIMLIEDAAFKMRVPVPIEVEKLKSVTKIEVSMESWAD